MKKSLRGSMIDWKKQMIRGSYALYVIGVSFILVAISAILKFSFFSLFYLMYPIYIVALVVIGCALIFCSLSYYAGGVRFSTTAGMIAAGLSIGLGIGYFLMGIFLLPFLFDIFMLGVALTIIKIFLFFYPFISMYYFFEIRHGKWGGIGALLILFFSTSHHFFIFSTEFYRTLPGSILTTVAGIGYILQGYSMRKSILPPNLSPPKKRKWIHINTFKE